MLKQLCPRCKKFLNLEDYTLSTQGKKGSYCRECSREYGRERSRRLWQERVSQPGYVPGKRGRKPDPETPLKQALKRAEKNEAWALTKEIWGVKASMSETYDFKREFKSKCRKLGLDFEEVWIAYTSHDGTCQICGIHESKLDKRLAVDHCHDTGEFRGFLCQNCNFGLGFLGDTFESLEKAVGYLKKF